MYTLLKEKTRWKKTKIFKKKNVFAKVKIILKNMKIILLFANAFLMYYFVILHN